MGIDSIEKPKLPKGLSYVLKTSMLEKALKDNSLNCHLNLRFRTHIAGSLILQAFYWLPNANVPYPRVYVRAGCVSSTERKHASDALKCIVLPEFIQWLKKIIIEPTNSTIFLSQRKQPYFDATYCNGEVAIKHTFKISTDIKL